MCIFLDVSKAFYTINHHILLKNYISMGSEDSPMHGFQAI